MGMRPEGRDSFGVPSQGAPFRALTLGGAHHTLHTRRRFAPRAAASRLSDYPLRFARVCCPLTGDTDDGVATALERFWNNPPAVATAPRRCGECRPSGVARPSSASRKQPRHRGWRGRLGPRMPPPSTGSWRKSASFATTPKAKNHSTAVATPSSVSHTKGHPS